MDEDYKSLLECFGFDYIEYPDGEDIIRYYELHSEGGEISYVCSSDTIYIHSGIGLGYHSAGGELPEDNQYYGYEIKIKSFLHLQNVLVGLLVTPHVIPVAELKEEYLFKTKGE